MPRKHEIVEKHEAIVVRVYDYDEKTKRDGYKEGDAPIATAAFPNGQAAADWLKVTFPGTEEGKREAVS